MYVNFVYSVSQTLLEYHGIEDAKTQPTPLDSFKNTYISTSAMVLQWPLIFAFEKLSVSTFKTSPFNVILKKKQFN